MVRIKIIVLLIFFVSSASFAQDSVKKSKAVKPATLYKPYKYHGYPYHKNKKDTAAKAAYAVPAGADTAAGPKDKSLNSQYQYLLSKVYHYQQPLISALWKNASDTLNANRGKLKAALNKLNVETKTIDSLNTELNNQGQTLSSTNTRINGISLFGLTLPKTTYNLLMWGLLALLAVVAVVVIMRSGGYRNEAKYRTQLYTELEEEFKTYKAKANDKEKKLARELQTERNKLDELLGR